MNKNDRLSIYLNLLSKKDFVSVEEFSKILNISTRTVFRDIKTIEELGIKIKFESKKGYFISNVVPKFSKEELDVLFKVGSILKDQYKNSNSVTYKNALSKLLQFIKDFN